jgi:hypothetical protein
MKNIDDLLRNTRRREPRRELSAGFVDNVLHSIEHSSTSTLKKGNLFMKLTHKPLFAALAIGIVLATGSTAYAAVTNWPSIQSFFAGEHALDSGARIVKVDTKGCNLDDKSAPTSDGTRYYEVRKDSPFTNDQVVAMAQGVCEEERANEQTTALYKELAKDAHGSVNSISFLTIEHVDKDSITVVTDKKYQELATNPGADRKTYHVAEDVRAADGATPMQYSGLKTGDTVSLIAVDARNISTEKQGYVEDLSQIQIKGIVKVPAFTGSPALFYKNIGKEFVRAEPTPDGKGFVRAYEFEQ